MFKKITAIILGAAILTGTTLVLANKIAEQNSISEYEAATEFNIEAASQSETNRIANMAEYIKSLQYDINEANGLIYDYAYAVQIYSKNNDELDYIDSLIYGGANIKDVIEIYEFWLTTNESVEIIGQIYNKKDEITDRYWIEEAYNQITEHKHGVLNADEVSEYINKGLQITDIHTANKLCRKGVYTIQEILDRLISGDTWDEIVSDIENSDLKSAKVNDSAKILAASDMSLKTNSLISNYIINDYALESLDAKVEEIDSKTEDEVYTTLTALGVLNDPLTSNDNNAALVQDIKNIISKNGVSETELEQLLNDGYMLMDILNASEVSKSENISVEIVLADGGEE